jgi:xanthine dehydrogenase accessory factor
MQRNFSTGLNNHAPFFQPDATQQQVLERLHLWRASGAEAALIAITAIEGRTSRAVGTLMAVSSAGDVAGSISGGCFDSAVIAEAQAALAGGKIRELRLGAGSPWIDIKLPCGGGLDLLILPNPDSAMLATAVDAIGRGDRHTLLLERAEGPPFALIVKPRLRLIVAGNGGEVLALTRLALDADAQVVALSPEKPLLDALPSAAKCVHLKTPDNLDGISMDENTALAVFFHDHDWEPPLLAHALSSNAFFIGAMGSLATHEQRCLELRQRGIGEAAIARLVSPLGLFAPARDPQALAVSALAQILSLRT